MIGIKKPLIATLLALAMAFSTASFAAYGLPETPAPVSSYNWYLGALGGVSFVSNATLNNVNNPNFPPPFNTNLDQVQVINNTGWDFGAELGYRSGPLRYEAQYMRLSNKNNLKFNGILFTNNNNNNLVVNAGMVNVLYDFGDIHSSYIPYLGGGIGYANISNTNFTSDNKFAYQAMLGVGFNLVDNALIDIGYRFFGTTTATHTLNKAYISNMINVGLVYYVA